MNFESTQTLNGSSGKSCAFWEDALTGSSESNGSSEWENALSVTSQWQNAFDNHMFVSSPFSNILISSIDNSECLYGKNEIISTVFVLKQNDNT